MVRCHQPPLLSPAKTTHTTRCHQTSILSNVPWSHMTIWHDPSSSRTIAVSRSRHTDSVTSSVSLSVRSMRTTLSAMCISERHRANSPGSVILPVSYWTSWTMTGFSQTISASTTPLTVDGAGSKTNSQITVRFRQSKPNVLSNVQSTDIVVRGFYFMQDYNVIYTDSQILLQSFRIYYQLNTQCTGKHDNYEMTNWLVFGEFLGKFNKTQRHYQRNLDNCKLKTHHINLILKICTKMSILAVAYTNNYFLSKYTMITLMICISINSSSCWSRSRSCSSGGDSSKQQAAAA